MELQLLKNLKLISILRAEKGSFKSGSLCSIFLNKCMNHGAINILLREFVMAKDDRKSLINFCMESQKSTLDGGSIVILYGRSSRNREISYALKPFQLLSTCRAFLGLEFEPEILDLLLPPNFTCNFILLDSARFLVARLSNESLTVLEQGQYRAPHRYATTKSQHRHHVNAMNAVLKKSLTWQKGSLDKFLIGRDVAIETIFPELWVPKLSHEIVSINGATIDSLELLIKSNLAGSRISNELSALGRYSAGSPRVSDGVQETCFNLKKGNVEVLLVSENVAFRRYKVKDSKGNARVVYRHESFSDLPFYDSDSGKQLAVIQDLDLIDWLHEQVQIWKCRVVMITENFERGRTLLGNNASLWGLLLDRSEWRRGTPEWSDDDE